MDDHAVFDGEIIYVVPSPSFNYIYHVYVILDLSTAKSMLGNNLASCGSASILGNDPV